MSTHGTKRATMPIDAGRAEGADTQSNRRDRPGADQPPYRSSRDGRAFTLPRRPHKSSEDAKMMASPMKTNPVVTRTSCPLRHCAPRRLLEIVPPCRKWLQ